MYNLVMDMVNGFGYLILPGFLALSMYLCLCSALIGLAEVKPAGCRVSGRDRSARTAAGLQRIKY